MPSKAKQKGSGWERDICVFLGSVFDQNFQRVPNSGAFLGKSNSFRKDILSSNQKSIMKSDIIPPVNMTKLNIEAKNYATIAFHQILTGNCPILDKWIEQTEESADPGDLSFTIFKITRKGSWVVFKETLKEHFILSSYMTYLKLDTGYIITDHENFFSQNKDKVVELSAPVNTVLAIPAENIEAFTVGDLPDDVVTALGEMTYGKNPY